MENDYKRKLSEVLALYELEPNSKELYLEGKEDSNIFDFFLKENSISDVSVYEINSIDFSEITDIDLSSNKEKVKYFSQEIYKKFGNNLEYITCVIDRDFDTIDDKLLTNYYLLYTDYANLEMYLFNKPCLNKLIQIGLKNFPFSSTEILTLLEPILIDIYSIRYARQEVDNSYQLPALDKSFKITSGKFIYSADSFLDKFITKNGCLANKEYLLEQIEIVKDKFNDLKEPRFFIHGKDFLELLFNFVRKVKNPYNFNLKTFTRSIFITIETGFLKSFDLFYKLLSKYKSVNGAQQHI